MKLSPHETPWWVEPRESAWNPMRVLYTTTISIFGSATAQATYYCKKEIRPWVWTADGYFGDRRN